MRTSRGALQFLYYFPVVIVLASLVAAGSYVVAILVIRAELAKAMRG